MTAGKWEEKERENIYFILMRFRGESITKEDQFTTSHRPESSREQVISVDQGWDCG